MENIYEQELATLRAELENMRTSWGLLHTENEQLKDQRNRSKDVLHLKKLEAEIDQLRGVLAAIDVPPHDPKFPELDKDHLIKISIMQNIELGELRQRIADAENQAPFTWAWQHSHGKLASDLFNSEQEVTDAWGSFSASGKPIPLYAHPIPSDRARITEQDAREIIESFNNWWSKPNPIVPGLITDHAAQVVPVYLDDEGRTLLNKLNAGKAEPLNVWEQCLLDATKEVLHQSHNDNSLVNLHKAVDQLISIAKDADSYKPAVSAPESLDERMKAAGMLSVTQLLSGAPMDAFVRHAGVKDLPSLLQWAEMRRAECLRSQAEYDLGKERDDMYEWYISHSAVFTEVHVNLKAAMLSASPAQDSEGGAE